MHIPDGFLSTPVWGALNAISLPAIGLAARRIGRTTSDVHAPMMGILGAFVFAAQMINVPIAAGTSAHLLGGALLSATLGPAAAMIAMTAVLVVQALVFQDGGLLALGANIFNLAIIGVICGYVPWSLLGGRWPSLAAFLGGACSVAVSGALAMVELIASGVPVSNAVWMMALGLFTVSAALEGLITAAVVRALMRRNPDLLRRPRQKSPLRILAVVSILIAGLGFTVASAYPDSLEKMAESLRIDGQEAITMSAPMPDYTLPGVKSEHLAQASAGLIGLALVFSVCAGAARLLRRSS